MREEDADRRANASNISSLSFFARALRGTASSLKFRMAACGLQRLDTSPR